jgi:hypothetical protein
MSSTLTKTDGAPRILLGQLGALGDVLYATAVARQIKHDFPNCHLTWGIGAQAAGLLAGNPDVDSVWQWTEPVVGHRDMADSWNRFALAAKNAEARGEYDAVYLTQIFPNNYRRFDGTVRQSIFRGYPGRITVPVEPRIVLSDVECENVDRFVRSTGLLSAPFVVMFEYGSNSSQSFVTNDFAREFAIRFIELLPQAMLVLASKSGLDVTHSRVVDASCLSFRENAQLTHHVSMLIGVSSGISWLCTSTWARKLPTIQLLAAERSVYASMVHDFEYRGADVSHIIEMTDCPVDTVLQCVKCAIEAGFPAARERFHVQIQQDFQYWLAVMRGMLLRGEFEAVAEATHHTMRRYGYQPHIANVTAEMLRQAFLLRIAE